MFTKRALDGVFAQKQKVTGVGVGDTNQSFKSSNATTMVGGPKTFWTPLSFVEYIEFYALLGETKQTHPWGAKLIYLRGIPGNHRGCDLQCDCGPRTSGNEWEEEVTICIMQGGCGWCEWEDSEMSLVTIYAARSCQDSCPPPLHTKG